VREHSRPYLIEAITYRFRGHSMSDPGKYRSAAEVEHWKSRDPDSELRQKGSWKKVLHPRTSLTVLEAKARAVVKEAVEFAEQSPWPDDSEVWTDIYASTGEEECPWLK
jgi:pyruvate dehydrogenase E1 component alpha subunit